MLLSLVLLILIRKRLYSPNKARAAEIEVERRAILRVMDKDIQKSRLNKRER